MCINCNTGDKVIITCTKKDAEIIGIYVQKCIDGHIIEIESKGRKILQKFIFDDWEVERV